MATSFTAWGSAVSETGALSETEFAAVFSTVTGADPLSALTGIQARKNTMVTAEKIIPSQFDFFIFSPNFELILACLAASIRTEVDFMETMRRHMKSISPDP
jgi:hypothetical protein